MGDTVLRGNDAEVHNISILKIINYVQMSINYENIKN